MLVLLGVFETVVNFFRNIDSTVQWVIFVVALLALLFCFRKVLKAKDGYNIGWLISTIIVFVFLLFYTYAVF